MKRSLVLSAIVILGACASEPDVSPEDAARADCESRQVAAAQMAECIRETAQTIREAEDLRRLRPPAPAPRPPG